MQQQQRGFILVLTLLILSLAIIVVNQFFISGTTTVFFDRAMIDREKAKTLAYGAIQLAQSQLVIIKEKEESSPEKKSASEKKDTAKQEKKFLERIVPNLNRWQTIELTEKKDGINAIIKLCISSEDGKLNINHLYDFEKKKFISFASSKDTKTLDKKTDVSEVGVLFESIQKLTESKDLLGSFEKFLKDRQYKLNDVTELLKNSDFQQAFKNKIFYEPPVKNQASKQYKKNIYLMDLFTIFSATGKLEPWLLSDSVAAVLGLERAQADDTEKRKQLLADMLKEFKPSISLEKDWNTLFKPMYSKEFKSLKKEIHSMFQTTFSPQTFSVIIHATVGAITQKLYVILHRTNQEDFQQFNIQRLYWF